MNSDDTSRTVPEAGKHDSKGVVCVAGELNRSQISPLKTGLVANETACAKREHAHPSHP